MTETNTETLLNQARRLRNDDQIAVALVNHADTLVNRGNIGKAQQLLDEAALIHKNKGRTYDLARCTHLSATLCRLQGDFNQAVEKANQALELVGPNNPVAVSVATELGEIALAKGDAADAIERFSDAINQGEVAGLLPNAIAALKRKKAIALAGNTQFLQAATELDSAYHLYSQSGMQAEAIQSKIEQASALQSANDSVAARRVHDDAVNLAEKTGDHRALADLHLFSAAQAIENRQLNHAMSLSKAAREEALTAVAPTSYIAAACAISEISEKMQDRLGAYEALAVAWVTIADLLGKDFAKLTFAPKLEVLLKHWGESNFHQVKTEYETRRKQALSNTHTH